MGQPQGGSAVEPKVIPQMQMKQQVMMKLAQ